MAYTVITGTVTYPTQVPYQLISLNGNITLSWPSSFDSDIVAASYSDVLPSAANYNITLPDATLGTAGSDTIFSNISTNNFNIRTNDGALLYTMTPGQIMDFKLYDTSTAAGLWRIIPFGGGYNGIVAFTAKSSDGSIIITGGNNVQSPGGTIDFQLPASITNLNNVATTGLAVIKTTSPLTWTTTQLVAGDNITITDPDGIDGNPVISLNSSVTGFTSVQVGDIDISDSEITTTATDGSVAITSNGKGYVILNDVTIDTSGNMVVNGNLEVTGTFENPFTPKAWCVFTDILNVSTHDITVQSQSNVSSVEFVSTGNYKINFTTPLPNINYAPLITTGTTGGPLPFVSHAYFSVRETGYVTITIVDASGQLVTSVPNGASIMIMSL